MKRILFNGCSFVAGDAVAWNQYCLTHNKYNINWKDGFGYNPKRTSDELLFYQNYRSNYRKEHNLPYYISKNLNMNKEDISNDGNSNDMIALSTIMHLLNKSPDERKQYHVCIGWSSKARVMKFNKVDGEMANLNIQSVNSIQQDSTITDYALAAIGNAYNEDFFINFIKNIILLENFLIANNITYTFFKAMGSYKDTTDIKFNSIGKKYNINSLAVSDIYSWYKFDNIDSNHLPPHIGTSWAETVIKNCPDFHIDHNNVHPNLKAVIEFSKDISEFIKSQNILDEQ